MSGTEMSGAKILSNSLAELEDGLFPALISMNS